MAASSSTSSSTSGAKHQLEVCADMRVGFIGAGRMAQAMAKGFINQGIIKPGNIWASARTDETLSTIGKYNVNTTKCNETVVDNTDVLIMSVKPQMLADVLKGISQRLNADKLVVSVAAGVTIGEIESHLFGSPCRIARVMPNTPLLANCGASVYCAGASAKPEDCRLIESLFGAVGTCDRLPERLMNSATAICGSGPAYFFVAIEAMADAGVNMGLPRDVAQRLAAQTVRGAGQLVLQSGQHPAELKDAVASPAGTTIAALQQLEKCGFRSALGQAVEQATMRANKLGSTKPASNS